MSLLTLVERIADEIGFAKPASVIGSSDETAIQMLALANRGGNQLTKRGKGTGGWSILQTENTFTTTNGTAQYALPSDFDYLIDDTLWDRTNFWKLRGPLSPHEWQTYKSGIAGSIGPRRRVRIRKNSSPTTNVNVAEIDPTPTTTGDTLVFEYMSLNWCQSSIGTAQTAWAADTDTGILDEYLLEMDLKWRFLSAKGQPYAEEKREFEMELAQALARDGGSPILSMTTPTDRIFIDESNLPETNYGS